VVIEYETFAKIHDCRDRQGLTIAQTARALGLDARTVARRVFRSRFEPRRNRPRGSVLDPFKPRITRLLDTHPYSAQQIFQRLREEGYHGGVTILRDYVRRIRPTKRPVGSGAICWPPYPARRLASGGEGRWPGSPVWMSCLRVGTSIARSSCCA
jgi:hypothetical protein